MAWKLATYDVISRNHSNWPSLNLSQKRAKDKRTVTENAGGDVLSYRKRLKQTSVGGGGGGGGGVGGGTSSLKDRE